MQTTMNLETCCRCCQPIAPGEPAKQTASVDIDDHGTVVSSLVRAYHLTGECYDDYRRRDTLPDAA